MHLRNCIIQQEEINIKATDPFRLPFLFCEPLNLDQSYSSIFSTINAQTPQYH